MSPLTPLEEATPAGARPRRLLVVDDLADNRNLLAELLEDDFQITLAADGREAIACIEQERPDLVLLDLMMPVLDGFGVLAYLQAHLEPFLPVIVLTADTEREQRLRALQLGANEFLDKPVDIQELRVRVSTLMALKRSREEVERQSAQLLKHNQELLQQASELRQAYQELALTKQAVDEAMLAKSLFLATMSHEIRTPLAAILGFAALLHDRLDDRAAVVEAQRVILRNGQHLQHIIDGILDISKLESGDVELEHITFDLFTLLDDVEIVAGLQAKDKGLAFAVDLAFPLPSLITTDANRLMQILLNLCSNAVKFTPSGEVRLGVRCDIAGGRLYVAVSDTGIGMTDAQMAQLFQPFAQADASTTRRFGGTGLGLYISRALALKLGGSLEVSSVVGQGSRFELEIALGALTVGALALDLSDAKEFRAPVLLASVPVLTGRVLLAEDGPDLQKLLTYLVQQTGASIDVVENGRLAVEAALARDYQLILMDMNMPVMGGLEATGWLRRAGCRRPIVAVSANVLAEDVAGYLKAGCTAALAKPIDRERLYRVLETHLSAATGTPRAREAAFEEELARDFLAELPAALLELQAAAADRDADRLYFLAHRLRGTAASLGFPELGAAAGLIESHVRAADMEAALRATADLVANH